MEIVRLSFLLPLGALLMVGAPCWAQDTAAAGALFDRGLADMQAGKFESGCPALAESFRLDARAGTLFTLAECESKSGRIASAFVHYEDYLSRFAAMSRDEQGRQRGRDKIADKQVALLKPDLPQLTIRLPDGTTGMTVTRDGVALGAASIGVAMPVDPGAHTIVVRNTDGAELEHHVEIARAEKKTIDIVPPPKKIAALDLAHAPSPPEVAAPTSLRPWAYATLGAGVVGIGIGAVTGGLVLGKKDTIGAHCVELACDTTGKQAADAAQTLGTISTVSFVAGGVFAVVSVVLFVLEPHRAKSSAIFFPSPQGATLVGQW